MAEPLTLIANRVRYFHESDEALFFAWLDRMKVVSGYEGRGDGLHIRLARHPNDDDLRELIAFHQRYAIDMRQLAAFKAPGNACWFAAPGMYWYQAVFGPVSA
ncbi:hypothetical protein C8J44_2245 [Sphingomonas sp. PP-CE-3A-406]|uniref:hypothetical protein n=1 Tax=unclassified Sphingomonas TaxID=196159 RepID=UPI0007132D5C|nr:MULTISPECIES: hypothetical protein [unclassified Sphingomonas]KQO12086.1 hypothetical protein ASF09_19295 [Sphingomonas sp. Leaf242]RMB54623.1 hypothetical protein C8J44_2245 [Sphingomonas sp. PP-CE-3A-406]